MNRYIAQRLLLFLPVLVGVTIVTFVLERVVPGDLVNLLQGEGGANAILQPDQVAEFERQLGLDRPIPIQYLMWLRGLVTGDLGDSLYSNRSVLGVVASAYPITLQLAVMSTVISVFVGVPAGILSAIRADSALDHVTRIGSITALAIPNFWIGALVLTILGVVFEYAPPFGYTSPFEDPWVNFQQMLWPSVVLGLSFAATILRVLRSSMLEVMSQDYVRTARAKGLSPRTVVVRHALRNAAIPTVTVTGAYFGYLLGGSVVVEQVFSLPGLGQVTLQSVLQKDFPQVQANVVFFAITLVLLNLVVDLSYGVLDPRIRNR